MAFAHTTQRKYEALRPFGHIGLLGMRHNAGVKQGCRFVGIFMTKMGADEEGLFVTGLAFAEFDSFNFVIPAQEECRNVAMSPGKIAQHALNFLPECLIVQRENPVGDPL